MAETKKHPRSPSSHCDSECGGDVSKKAKLDHHETELNGSSTSSASSSSSNGTSSSSEPSCDFAVGAICHLDYPGKDLARMQKFYGDVFGWTFQQYMPNYVLFRPPGKGVSGGFYSSDVTPSRDNIFHSHLFVENIEKTLDKIHQHGGTVLASRFLIAKGIGCNAFFLDTEGNKVGLWCKDEEGIVPTKDLEHKVHFTTLTPIQAYNNFTDEQAALKWCEAKGTKVSPDQFGEFTYSGWVTGRHIDMEPGVKLVQSWRGANFPAGHFSLVTFTFESDGATGCHVTLKQKGVPEELYDMLCNGWFVHTWNLWGEGTKTP